MPSHTVPRTSLKLKTEEEKREHRNALERKRTADRTALRLAAVDARRARLAQKALALIRDEEEAPLLALVVEQAQLTLRNDATYVRLRERDLDSFAALTVVDVTTEATTSVPFNTIMANTTPTVVLDDANILDPLFQTLHARFLQFAGTIQSSVHNVDLLTADIPLTQVRRPTWSIANFWKSVLSICNDHYKAPSQQHQLVKDLWNDLKKIFIEAQRLMDNQAGTKRKYKWSINDIPEYDENLFTRMYLFHAQTGTLATQYGKKHWKELGTCSTEEIRNIHHEVTVRGKVLPPKKLLQNRGTNKAR